MKAAKDGLQTHCRKCQSEMNKDWRERNHEKRREYHLQERFKEARRQYKKSNPDVIAAQQGRRRELKKTPLTLEERRRIRAVFRLRDLVSEWTGLPYEVDHIVPLARGGKHHPDNLQLLTAAENRKKAARMPTSEVGVLYVSL